MKKKTKPDDVCDVCKHVRAAHCAEDGSCTHQKCRGRFAGCEEFRTKEQVNAQTARSFSKRFKI